MSLHLEFEPHSWYKDFAIKDNRTNHYEPNMWEAYTADGNTYQIIELNALSLANIKWKIDQYHLRQGNGYGERMAKRRLEHLRTQLQNENISYSELAELQSLSKYIEAGDVELLEAAGVPENDTLLCVNDCGSIQAETEYCNSCYDNLVGSK